MSVVKASGRAGPRCTPWPPAGSDDLCKRGKGRFLSHSSKGGGGVKRTKRTFLQLKTKIQRPAMAEEQDWEESKLSQVPYGEAIIAPFLGHTRSISPAFLPIVRQVRPVKRLD